MTDTHTPWRASPYNPTWEAARVITGDQTVCDVFGERAEAEDRARLIAAAPDLKRAVSDAAHIITYMLEGERDEQDMRDFLEQASAVVAKVEKERTLP